MINIKQAKAIAGDLCTCNDMGDCDVCSLYSFAEKAMDTVNKLFAINRKCEETENIQAKAMEKIKHTHNIHIEALQAYYHLLHKDCPCLQPPDSKKFGPCGSPWRTI